MEKHELDRHVRCKCGKNYGMKKFRKGKICSKCKTTVAARGLKK